MPVLAWHFVGDTLRDGSPIPADGVTLSVDPPIILCERGLHASERIIDALQYAPGNTLCRVKCSGLLKRDEDKLAAPKRTILWRVDAEEVLRKFARQCALDVAHLWDMPDVVRQYLETGDESLRDAAGTAAGDAAWDAAGDAAWDADWDAAGAAAWDAAWDAAWAAAGDARAAALGAAGDARAAQNERLTAMIMEIAPPGATL